MVNCTVCKRNLPDEKTQYASAEDYELKDKLGATSRNLATGRSKNVV